MALADDRPAGRPRPVRPAGEGAEPNGAFDRQPPQDLTAEQSVLGAMMLSKDAIADVVEIPRPDDFYRTITWLVTGGLMPRSDPDTVREVNHEDEEDTGPLPRVIV